MRDYFSVGIRRKAIVKRKVGVIYFSRIPIDESHTRDSANRSMTPRLSRKQALKSTQI